MHLRALKFANSYLTKSTAVAETADRTYAVPSAVIIN